jgi:hypothetical protein
MYVHSLRNNQTDGTNYWFTPQDCDNILKLSLLFSFMFLIREEFNHTKLGLIIKLNVNFPENYHV